MATKIEKIAVRNSLIVASEIPVIALTEEQVYSVSNDLVICMGKESFIVKESSVSKDMNRNSQVAKTAVRRSPITQGD